MSLLERQKAFIAALSSGEPSDGLAPLAGVDIARGFRAYRHNAMGLAGTALASVFGSVKTELGEASFEAMAWAFWRACPPERGDLAQWGEALPAFLAAQHGMDPALCELARLEWARHVAERAADVELDVASLNLLAGTPPERLRLLLRPGTALLGDVLVWRKAWRARHRRLSSSEAAFMRALLDGKSLEAALAVSDCDFSAWLQEALRDGFLQGVKETSS